MLGACGGAPVTATEPAAAVPDDVHAAATAPIERADVPGIAIAGATSVGGRVVPYGSSGSADAMVLTEPSVDPTYGYTEANPIRLGGMSEDAERAFLAALWGPEGQPLYWGRIGSCCPLPDFGMLDVFSLEWEGAPSPIVLYVDLYHRDDPRIPVGLTSPGRSSSR